MRNPPLQEEISLTPRHSFWPLAIFLDNSGNLRYKTKLNLLAFDGLPMSRILPIFMVLLFSCSQSDHGVEPEPGASMPGTESEHLKEQDPAPVFESNSGTKQQPKVASQEIPVTFDYITERECEEIFARQLKHLKYLGVKNPPFAVMFSGTQAMGKTTLARKIEDEFKGLRYSTDVARAYMSEENIEITKGSVYEYSRYFLKEISKISENRFIVFDSTVDRKYQLLKDLLSKAGIRDSFLIRIEIPYEEVKMRLRERGDASTVLPHFDNYYRSHALFGNMFTDNIDITLKESVKLTKEELNRLTKLIANKYSRSR